MGFNSGFKGLTCVLIQNGPMTLILTHQKTLTFNTQTPSSLCATKEVKKYWLLSVAVQVLIILDVVLWVCVCVSCIPVQNHGYSTTLKWAISSELSANSGNHMNPQCAGIPQKSKNYFKFQVPLYKIQLPRT